MFHRKALYLSLLLFVGSALFGQPPGSPVPTTPSITEESAVAANSPLTKSIGAVIEAVGPIKAGMTRADLLTVFYRGRWPFLADSTDICVQTVSVCEGRC
jgi:hypothetical protein